MIRLPVLALAVLSLSACADPLLLALLEKYGTEDVTAVVEDTTFADTHIRLFYNDIQVESFIVRPPWQHSETVPRAGCYRGEAARQTADNGTLTVSVYTDDGLAFQESASGPSAQVSGEHCF